MSWAKLYFKREFFSLKVDQINLYIIENNIEMDGILNSSLKSWQTKFLKKKVKRVDILCLPQKKKVLDIFALSCIQQWTANLTIICYWPILIKGFDVYLRSYWLFWIKYAVYNWVRKVWQKRNCNKGNKVSCVFLNVI